MPRFAGRARKSQAAQRYLLTLSTEEQQTYLTEKTANLNAELAGTRASIIGGHPISNRQRHTYDKNEIGKSALKGKQWSRSSVSV